MTSFLSFKRRVSYLLSELGSVSGMRDSDLELFRDYSEYYFRLIPPIIRSDLETLDEIKQFYSKYCTK